MKNRTYIAGLFLVLCLLSSGCGSTEQAEKPAAKQAVQQVQAPAIKAESEALFEKGLAAYNEFDYNKAIALYDQALAADEHNYKALSGKGIALAMRGNGTTPADVKKGISLIRKALELAPDYVPTYYDLALALKIDQQYDEAITWFQKVIDREPDNTWSYYGIATIYGDRGQAHEAVSWLKKAAALDKANVKDAARTQSHFDRIRTSPEFKQFMDN